MPLWGFSNDGGRVRLYCRKSLVILSEECGYIPGRVQLYCRKSVVIFPEECGYMAGRVRLYSPEVCGYMCQDDYSGTIV